MNRHAFGWVSLLWICITPALASAQDAVGDGTAAAAPLPKPADPMPIVRPTYTVGAGDAIQVRVYEEERLSGSYAVTPDGRVDLPWVGKVNVAGLGVQQIADLVESRYADGFLVSPQVVVQVDAYGSQPVQILGNIKKPGTYYLRGETELVDLLAQAGGIAQDDQLSTYEVKVKRAHTANSEPLVVNLDRLMHLGEGNLAVTSGDVIHITRGRVVFVSGQVTKPGPVAWREGLTITQLMSAAGGSQRTANLRKALILRGDQRIMVSIRDIQRGRIADFAILPEDQVIIEESAF
jgi:polysaccharide export outer membrane protein